jgi:hypothetical protein
LYRDQDWLIYLLLWFYNLREGDKGKKNLNFLYLCLFKIKKNIRFFARK